MLGCLLQLETGPTCAGSGRRPKDGADVTCKCITLHTIDGEVYCEVGRDCLLHVADCVTIAKLTASQIVLLVAATVTEHMGPRHVH